MSIEDNDDKLIADQARKIAELEEKVNEFNAICGNIHSILFCVGGPLNDNKLGFTPEQQKVFFRISEQLEWTKSLHLRGLRKCVRCKIHPNV